MTLWNFHSSRESSLDWETQVRLKETPLGSQVGDVGEHSAQHYQAAWFHETHSQLIIPSPSRPTSGW